MKARLIKRQDNQPEAAQQAAKAPQPKKSTARLVAQAVSEWKQGRQQSPASDARTMFAALFAPPPVGCE